MGNRGEVARQQDGAEGQQPDHELTTISVLFVTSGGKSTATVLGNAEGFAVRIVGPNEVLGNLGQVDVDCVVCEYRLPEKDGLDVLAEFRAEYPALPFVLATGEPIENLADEALSAGASDIVNLPSNDSVTLLSHRIRATVDRLKAERSASAEQKGELRRIYRALETAQEGIALLDDEGEFVYVNQAYANLHDYDPDEMQGKSWMHKYADNEAERVQNEILPKLYEDGTWTGETEGLRRDESTFRESHSLSTTADGGLVCTIRDVSEEERRKELVDYYRSVVEDVFGESKVGVFIVDSSDRVAWTNRTTEEYFGLEDIPVEGRKMGELVDKCLKRQVADPSMFAERAARTDGNDASTNEFEARVLPSDRRDERYLEHRCQPIESGEYAGGRLELYYDVTERRRAEVEHERTAAELERSNERLRTLNELNELIQDVTQTLVMQSDRESIERTVCEQLAGANLYAAASIGDAVSEGGEVQLRTYASDESSAESDYSATVLKSEAAMRAVSTDEVQVVRGIDEVGTESSEWLTQAREQGHRAALMVPIRYDETSYGVLILYTTRPNPGVSQERTVVRRLGEVIGHAINGVETKQRLLADTAVELEFQSADPAFFFNTVSEELDCTVRLADIVPGRDGDFVYYVTVENAATDDALEAFDRMDAVKRARYVSGESDGESVFEVSIAGPSIGRVLTEHEGKVTTAVSEESTTKLTANVGPHSDVRTIVDAINANYSEVEFTARREVDRADPGQVRNVFNDELTEKQRSAVQAAYQSGFYSWPRESTGEEVAESLGISAPTYHQHLRAAHETILSEVVSQEKQNTDDESE